MGKVKKDIEPTKRRKCPKCGSRTYYISRSYAYISQYKDGKQINKRFYATDAGSFNCNICRYQDKF